MKFLEPETLRGATSPIILTNWVFGIGIFECPIGHPRPVISLCWSIAHLCLLVTFVTVAESRDLKQVHISTVSMATYRFVILSNVVSVIVFVCFGRTASKIVSASIRKLNTVNEMMNKYEIFKEYRSTFKYQIIQMIGAFICLSVIAVSNIIVFAKGHYLSIPHICYLVGIHYTPTYSSIVDCTFVTFIRYIGKLFQHLNTNIIRCSLQKHNINSFLQGFELDDLLRPTTPEIHRNPHSFRSADRQYMMDLICNSRKLHQELCSTAKALDKAFGVQILLSMTMSSVLITAGLYNLYTQLVTSSSASASTHIMYLFIVIFRILFYTIRILSIVHISSMTSTQAQRMGELIHRLDKPTADSQVREEIHTFSLLLMQNPLRFTASGFFTLDFEMIRSMVGAVTTYLVIMIQLHNSYNLESELPNAIHCAMNTTY